MPEFTYLIPASTGKVGNSHRSRTIFQRKEATIIYETLEKVKEWFKVISLEEIKQKVTDIFRNSNFELEYFVIADEKTLKETDYFYKDKNYRAFIVAYADTVRLIDNMHLG
jgi:pantoate--beta-alanine ligase